MQRLAPLILALASLLGCRGAAQLTTQTCPQPAPASEATVATDVSPPAEWASFAFLLGTWEAAGTGRPGVSLGIATFSLDAGGHALVRRAVNESAEGRHEDLLVIYHVSGAIRALYVDNEDRVIPYAVSTEETPRRVVLVSDAAEGVPTFRLSYELLPDRTTSVRFEIAPPGSSEFQTYIEGTARRVGP